MFFTLFGAVAVVGVLGAGIMATMRGPLSTMVEINRLEQAKAEMRVGLRLILTAADDTSCEASGAADGFKEGPEPTSTTKGPAGGGFIPASVSASKNDPWGNPYGYCAWDNGTSFDGCGRVLAGSTDLNNIAVALISSGPDGKFQTECKADPVYVPPTGEGDDLVVRLNYADAIASSGGFWQPKGDTAVTIDKDVEIPADQTATFLGAASFQNNTTFSNSARLILGAASIALPTKDELPDGECNAANNLILRINNDGVPVIEICDGDNEVFVSATGLWKINPDDDTEIYYNGGNVGVGKIDATEPLDVAGNIKTNADIKLDAGSTIIWAENSAISHSGGNVRINSDGAGTEVDIGSGSVVLGAETVIEPTGTDALLVKTSGGATGFYVDNDAQVGIGTTSLNDALEVIGSIDLTETLKMDGGKSIEWSGAGSLAASITENASALEFDASGDGAVELTVDDGAVTVDGTATISGLTTVNDDVVITGGTAANALDVTGKANVSSDITSGGAVEGATFKITGDTGNFGPPPTCAANKKLEYDGGWSCVDDNGSGSGSGGLQTLAETLDAGNDADDQDATNFRNIQADDRIQADEFCDNTSPVPNCITIGGIGSSGGLFEISGTTVRTKDAAAPWASSDFIVGGSSLINQAGTDDDSRMFFDKSTAAFRAGHVRLAQWDTPGDYSAAFGYESQATGEASFAVGAQTVASGENSFAQSFQSTASGSFSSVMGNNSLASGYGSYAFGREVRVGTGTAQNTDANANQGNYSVGFGLGSSGAGNDPLVTGTSSFGIFFGDQTDSTITENNVFGLVGGLIQIDAVHGGADTDKGCIRYDDTNNRLQYSHDCSTYLNFGSASGSTAGLFELSGTIIRSKNADAPWATSDFVIGDNDGDLAGAGEKMYFDNSKGAFRAGVVDGTDWDEGSVGDYSTAFGANTVASGPLSLAGGGSSGIRSGSVTASGTGSIAWGDSTGATILSSGNFGIAMGGGDGSVTASGAMSFARGRTDLSSIIASGTASTAWGSTRGLFATKLGKVEAAGDGSTAFGTDVEVTSDFGVGIGLSEITGTDPVPVVSGAGSMGIFTGDQNSYDLSEANTLGLVGGVLMIDESTGTSGAEKGCIRFNEDTDMLEVSHDCTTYGAIATTSTNYWTGSGNDIYNSNSGNVGVGESSPQAKFHVDGTIRFEDFTSCTALETDADGDLVCGADGEGTSLWTDNTAYITRENVHIIDTGETLPAVLDDNGQRFFFYADKGALRGGEVSGGNDAWEDANIGENSLALGLNTQAKGVASVALGYGTTADNNYDFAMGYGTTASGSYATALGFSTNATAFNSTAIGNTSTASGYGSLVVGRLSTASGYHSMAFGVDVLAGTGTGQANSVSANQGNYSVAFGLGESGVGNDPRVTGTSSFGIFFGDQTDSTITENNVFGLVGGLIQIDAVHGGADTDKGCIRYEDTLNKLQFSHDCSTYTDMAGAGGSVALSSITAATGDNSINNAAHNQVWNWDLTGAETAFTFGENDPSAGGSNDQHILSAQTLATSTAMPLFINNLGAGRSFQVNDEASDSSPFVIDAAGNVGIGTSGPISMLHLNADGNSPLTIDRHSSDDSAQTIDFRKSRGDTGSPTIVQDGDKFGVIDFFGYDGTDYDNRGALIEAFVDGTPDDDDMPGGLMFSTTPAGVNGMADSYEERMVIKSTGNIGIGNMDPQAVFHVDGTVRFEDFLSCTALETDADGDLVCGADDGSTVALSSITAATGDNTINSSAHNQVWNWDLTGAETAFTFGENDPSDGGSNDQHILSAQTLATSTAMPLYISNLGAGRSFQVDDETTDTTPFVIDASGNVGIGTASPAARLDVAGTMKLSSGGFNSCTALETDADGDLVCGTDDGSTIPLSAITAATGDNSINSAAHNQVWNWALTGAETAFTFGENTAATGGDDDQHILSAATLASSTAMPLLINNLGDGWSLRINDAANDTTPFMIDETGNVGIGTTGPGEKLTIGEGSVRLGALSHGFIFGASNEVSSWNAPWYGISRVDEGDLLLDVDDGGQNQAPVIVQGFWGIGMRTDNATMVMTRTGYTGIGTENPVAAFQVDGTIRFEDFTSCTALETDADGDLVCGTDDTGSAVALSAITAATGDNSINNAAHNQVWNWDLTGAETAFTFGENDPSAGGSNDQHILSAATMATSTAMPLFVNNLGNGRSFQVNDEASDTSPFVIDASGNVGIGMASPSTKLDVTGTANVTDDLSVDTDTLFADASEDRVGINTATPSTSLHIESSTGEINANIGGMILENPVTPLIMLKSDENSEFASSFWFQGQPGCGGGATDTCRSTAGISSFDPSDNSFIGNPFVLNIEAPDKSFSLIESGNLGLGLPTPTAKLHMVTEFASVSANNATVASGIMFSGDLDLSDNADTTGVYGMAGIWPTNEAANSGGLAFGTRNTGAITEYVRISATGNVGVGEASPQAKFHVDGTVRFEDFTSCTALETDADGDLVCGADDNGAGSSLWTENAGEIYRSSNVGIGITNPAVQLHVSSADAAGTFVHIQNSGNDDTGLYFIGDRSWQIQNDGDASLGTADFLHFYDNTAAASRLTIATSGNIGMGEVNPQALLHVDGTVRFEDFLSCTALETNASGDLVCGADDTGAGSSLWTEAGGEIYRSGNVGIGNTNPAYNLHVTGTSAFTDDMIVDTSTLFVDASANRVGILELVPQAALHVDGTIRFEDFLSCTALETNASGDLVCGADDTGAGSSLWTEAAGEIYRSGNVGIGNTNPAYNLHVTGTSAFTDDMIVDTSTLFVDASANRVGILELVPQAALHVDGTVRFEDFLSCTALETNASGDLVCGADDSGSNLWTEAAGEIYRSSNVGILNTNPAYPLDVTGTANATTFRSDALQIWGNSTAGYIYNQAAGDPIYIQAQNASSTDRVMAAFDPDAASELYYAGTKRIETTSTGATITGNLFVDNGNLVTDSHLSIGVGGLSTFYANVSTKRVGVGTTVPTEAFDVVGTIEINPDDANERGCIRYDDTNNVLQYSNDCSSYTNFGSGGSSLWTEVAGEIYRSSNVGIGVTNPAYTLHVEGDAGKTGGGSWTNSSDIRLKDVLGDYERGLDDILRLKPIIFKYKEDNARDLPSESMEYGFVAQDVQKIFPEAVSEGDDGYLDFNMHSINVSMVNAIQDLHEENMALKTELASVQDSNVQIQEAVADLTKQVELLNKAAGNNIGKASMVPVSQTGLMIGMLIALLAVAGMGTAMVIVIRQKR